MRRLAAYRRLLENRDFTDEFLPGFVALAREHAEGLKDDAADAALRRAKIRLNHAQELETEMRQFVADIEARLAQANKAQDGRRNST